MLCEMDAALQCHTLATALSATGVRHPYKRPLHDHAAPASLVHGMPVFCGQLSGGSVGQSAVFAHPTQGEFRTPLAAHEFHPDLVPSSLPFATMV